MHLCKEVGLTVRRATREQALWGCLVDGRRLVVVFVTLPLRVLAVHRSIGLIKKIIPEKFWSVKGIENQVAKVSKHHHHLCARWCMGLFCA